MLKETYVTGCNQSIRTHAVSADCMQYNCAIHNPSKHVMANFPTCWRGDRGLMERICPHGVGHPDPDDIAHKTRTFGEKAKYEGIHGCDGCCA